MPNEAALAKAIREMHSAVTDLTALVSDLIGGDAAHYEKREVLSVIHTSLDEAAAAIRDIDLTKPVEG